MRVVERIGGLLVRPRETVRILAHGAPPLTEALLVLGLFSTCTWLSLGVAVSRIIALIALIVPFGMGEIFSQLVMPLLVGAILLLGAIYDGVNWLLWSLTAYLVIRGLGGGGDLEPTLVVVGYSWVRRVLPLTAVITAAFAPLASILVALILLAASWVWATYVVTLGVSEVHGVSRSKALVATLAWPLLKIVVLAFIPWLSLILRAPVWWFR